ncbi:10991_t:CDS:1, partial [Gigaspora rosea]
KVVENSNGEKIEEFWKRGVSRCFSKAKNKNTRDKNLSLFWHEEEDASYKPIISTRDACFHMVNKLIAKGLIRQNVIIEPLHSGSSILTYSCSIVSISDNAKSK